MRVQAATYYADVLPIFERHCLMCHRAGGVAPMRLDTYANARPWAKTIRQAVLDRKMPPWLADPSQRHFANERRFSEAEIATVAD